MDRLHGDSPPVAGEEGKAEMPRYLWGPDERQWEIIYHQAFRMWEIVDFEVCPFFLQYADLSGLEPESCRICGEESEPGVFLRNPETGTVLRDTGPICLDCVCGNRLWHTAVPISIPRSLLGEPQHLVVPARERESHRQPST
jgi:hypothetical protein